MYTLTHTYTLSLSLSHTHTQGSTVVGVCWAGRWSHLLKDQTAVAVLLSGTTAPTNEAWTTRSSRRSGMAPPLALFFSKNLTRRKLKQFEKYTHPVCNNETISISVLKMSFLRYYQETNGCKFCWTSWQNSLVILIINHVLFRLWNWNHVLFPELLAVIWKTILSSLWLSLSLFSLICVRPKSTTMYVSHKAYQPSLLTITTTYNS